MSTSGFGGELIVELDTPIPNPLEVGRGLVLPVSARFASPAMLRSGPLRISAGGPPLDARAIRDRDGTARLEGLAVVPSPGPAGAEIELTLETPGEVTVLGRTRAVERTAAPTQAVAQGTEIAICMATFQPDRELLARQLDSIAGQTTDDWICVISDDGSEPDALDAIRDLIDRDSRFQLQTGPRLGHYLNFERALRLAPDCELISFCDQDDRWYPSRLERLREAIAGHEAAYSDCRLVSRDGRPLADSYWRRRRNNHTNFASLAIANTVSGAAMVFRQRLLADGLPFPASLGDAYHDHWIALVALAQGSIAYVDKPLYDYVQHAAGTIGHSGANQRGIGRALDLRRRGQNPFEHAYQSRTRQAEVHARTLSMRLGKRVQPRARRALARLEAGDSAATALWLLVRPLRLLAGRNETIGREHVHLAGALWSRGRRLLQRPR